MSKTEVTGFVLLGLTDAPELQVPVLTAIALVYTGTAAGNLSLALLVLLDPRLHTPMYYFLASLALGDFSSSSAVTATLVPALLSGHTVVSYGACAAQGFLFGFSATVGNYLLASMAFDRCAAVCRPLHCASTVTPRVCAGLTAGCASGGILTASVITSDTFSLPFCGSNVVRHFFCEIPAVMALTCSDRHVNELVLVYTASFSIFFAVLVILLSYLLILITILKMRSAGSYRKALSTCASHLTAVAIFYGTVIFMYLQPSSRHSMHTDKMASVFYTMVIPVLNPLVYSLRNTEVKRALEKVVGRTMR